jgi:MoxR-like ATPase
LRAAQAEVATVAVTEETVDGMMAIRDSCQSAGIVASDRRWKKSLKLVRASAFIMGERRTTIEDLGVLVDSLWREPKERSKVARIVGQHADPTTAQAVEVLESARETARGVVSLKAGERGAYVGAAAKAIDLFVEQKNKLTELSRSGGKRSKIVIADAIREIQGMHAETQRVVSASLGLPSGLRAS